MEYDMPSAAAPLKIGTRGSPLALAQAHETKNRLMAAFELPEDAFEICVIKTTGDDRTLIDADIALKTIGNKGLFTKEIEEAMLAGRIDIAVHSTKDMPVEQPDGLVLDVFLPREDSRDAFVSIKHAGIADLPQGAIVGTSSLRRRAQLLAKRPDLQVVEFRGNVQTRLKKLGDGVADATFLAMAGLNRMDMGVHATGAIDVDEMLPAIAQGTISIERRADDLRARDMLAAIHDVAAGQQMAAERAFLGALDGSCETPIAGLALIEGDEIWLRGEILKPDGSQVFTGERRGAIADGAAMGKALAQELLAQAGPDFFEAVTEG
ncbi:hydroxymethylbilane synthase [Octadecabacter sp. 1_MG-2023]|uniref:hydroxymethylbilane synthase n=1 Tax=unclassified Octadecabacter TaxID=196158 RepID=UPI001C081350|nr:MULTISPECIES: hydroxymethylbilane synthase [unclassified Octadecabacter]MBU2994249.1 hydroxymethylbilane synthase [Octadecabacter sp. B2R22]MDO6734462.1 hydroxymethylbilane synthase [Octadecabacter sp. 1_MG-2023]